jgi:HSP20 family protein
MRMYDPFRELDALRREIDRALNNYPPGREGSSAHGRTAFLPGRSARAYPLVNLAEDADNVYIEALAPGVNPDTINLTVVRNTLTISGEKPAPQDSSPEAFHRNERAAGRFVRNLDLPVEVNADNVQAQYTNGLLNITLPKAEVAKPKQIRVNVS